MLSKRIKAVFHPELYHGWGKNKNYFEGWYYKIVSANEKHAFAFIPGIAMDNKGQVHSFIQILDGKKLKAQYIKFPREDFIVHSGSFKIEIGENSFERKRLKLNIGNIKGCLDFNNSILWPNKWYSPGIMGPFAFAPFLECYHGILSMDHEINGSLEINGENVNFTGGRGYMEKDWGHSFPNAYLWMQSNHFSQQGISLKASVANIPLLGCTKLGFIAGFYYNKQLLQFTTYNASKLIRSHIDPYKVEIILNNRKYRLEIIVHRAKSTQLASPIAGFMDGSISESMGSTLELRLKDRKNGELLFRDAASNVALDVAGDFNELIRI